MRRNRTCDRHPGARPTSRMKRSGDSCLLPPTSATSTFLSRTRVQVGPPRLSQPRGRPLQPPSPLSCVRFSTVWHHGCKRPPPSTARWVTLEITTTSSPTTCSPSRSISCRPTAAASRCRCCARPLASIRGHLCLVRCSGPSWNRKPSARCTAAAVGPQRLPSFLLSPRNRSSSTPSRRMNCMGIAII